MNGKSEESSTDNTSNNTSSSSSSSSSQENDPQHSNKEGTQASQSGEAPTETTVAQTSGELSSTGTNSSWSYNQSEEYQDQYYPEYQYPQEEESYDQESYYEQSTESQNEYYQGEEYYSPSNYQYSEQQQEGQSQSQSQSQLNSEQQQQQNGEKLQEDQQQQGDKEGHDRPHDQSQPSEVCSEQKQTVSNQISGEKGKCWECGAAFQDDELLRDHLALFHAEVHVHKCHSCPAVFPSQSSLTEHITTSHLVGASIQSANRAQQRERKDSTEDQNKLQETPNKGKSISVSGSESLSSLLAKGISVSGGDHSLTSLQAKENSESSDSPLSSLKAKGISISGGNSSLSSLQAKGISISGGDSSLSSLQAKGISIGRSVGDSSLTSLQTKGVSVSSGESPLKSLHAKGISISSSSDTSLTSLQAKGISISGSSDSSLSSLQAKGISISSGEQKGSGGDSSFSFLQSKGISISGASDSSLTSLQAKGISISGADSSPQSKGNSLSEGESPLSYLQSKGISISGAETSLQLKGVTKSGGGSPLSFLQGKGISISSADTSLQTKGGSLSSGASPLASLQAKGISISGTGAESSLASLKAKGISIAGADSSFLGKEDSASDNFSEEEENSTASETDSQPASLHAKHFATVKSQVESLQGKSVSLSSASSPLSLLQGKGVSLSAASPQPASSQGKEVPSPSEVGGPSKSSDTATPTTETKAVPSSSHSLEVASLRAKGISLYSSGNQVKYFATAAPKSVARSRAAFIKEKGIVLSKLPDPRPKVTAASGAKPKELLYRRKEYFGCVYCRIKQFRNATEFEKHHLNHVKQTTLKVILLQVNPEAYKRNKVETRRKKKSSELKLKLRISKVGRGRGRKRREVRIVSNEEGMSESHKSLEEREGSEVERQEEGEGEEGIEGSIAEEEQSSGETAEDQAADLQKDSEGNPGESSPSRDDCDEHQEELGQEEQGSQQGHEDHQKDQEEDSTAPPHQEEAHRPYNTRSNNNQNSNSNSGFDNNFGEQDLGFGAAGPSEAPPSTYQPQFESFPTSDWFSEYESGSRIVAAMAGATSADAGGEGGWGSGADGTSNPEYTADGGDKDGTNPEVNGRVNEGNGEDGLFSQAVLGQESPDKNDRQGSFEQLCLNDTYSGQAQNNVEGHPGEVQGVLTEEEQQQQQQQSGVASDLLSELEYLNNSGQPQGSHPGQVEGSPLSGGPSPHSGGPGTPSHLSSRGSNSGTPTSSGGHPTPPPTDTSFRALATSPMTSPTQATSPALMQGQTPPATSPLQQEQQQAGVPRLTIANNLMAPTTSSQMTPTTNNQAGVGGMMSRYGNQWPQGAGYTGTGGYANLSGTNMANSNMAGPLRAPLPPSVGLPYRPSPPARVRGRPPLMGQIGRPPLHQGSLLQPSRGPGRPPTSSILPPPLMPAPGGRGAMMPPLQRMHQGMYQGQRPSGPQQQNGTGKRPLLGATSHSPNKNARREDINVPSRQKDNECQIIAVANRADGLPVIANVQGGSGSNQRGSTTPTTSESTINLSDSITLSVRTSSANDKPQRGERGGADAGTVANLLASRGITVTPAAGERQEGAGGGRDDRRLPTAQELNLSSAISVHPPTQREREASVRERDRDGFAVPQAPVRGSSNANNVERPPRPPTVDLTQDVPSSGSQSTRHYCNQCDRSFPTAGLLADHSRVHQQHTQSRMPYKCHLCTAGFSTQKGQQHHYQQFHQIHLSAGDIAIPLVDLRNPVNVQRMAALGIRSFLPLTNLQNRGAGGVVGIPVLTLENLRNGHMTLQQWGVSDVLSLGPAKTLNMPR